MHSASTVRFRGLAVRVGVVVLLCSAPVRAVMVRLSTSELVRQAQCVVTGQVTAVYSAWDEDHTMIYTYVTLALNETILGQPDAEPIVIRTWGGDVAEGGCLVSDQPHFVAGELVLVFLEHDSTASRYYRVTGAFQGKFTIDGVWIVEKGVSLSAFVDQITGRTPAELLAPEAPPLTAAEGPRYSYPGYKWPESSMPIRYSINENGLDDCTFDEFKAIQRAGQVWEQVPGAYFSLCYAGTTSTNVQAQDGENVVAFVSMGANELGWGNVWYDADDWIYEADIRINKDKSWSAFSGNACSADRYDVQSLAAHEFGHWLYLGHSSHEDATMSVGLGKGEIWPRDLAADDISASRALYPHYDGRPHVQPGCWWWAPASPMMFSSLGIADFDRDGTDELIVGFGGGAAGVWALNGDGSCVRTDGIGTGQIVGSVPAVVELDGDMWLEVVVGSADNKVYVKNDDGTNVAGWPIATGGEVHSSPALGDIDGDGVLEIVIGSDDGKVYAWNANGTILDRDAAAPWDWPKTVGDKVQSSPALGDSDGNGGLDFVIVGSDDGNVYAWDYTGTMLAGWPKGTGDKVRSSPALGDIDDDDELEVIVGSDDGNVYAWNLDGTVVDRDGAAPWDWPNATGGAVSSSPALGDIDGDGDLDVVVGSADGKVYAWDHTGTTLSGWPVTTAESVLCSPIIGDMDGDNQQEVIVGSNDGRVHAWNGNGTVVTGWPSSIVDDITASPALGDIDDNGELELCVAIGGFLGYGVGCWDLGSPYNEDRLAWPVFGHDRYHTSNAGCHPPEITEMVHLEDFNPDRGNQDWGSGSQGCPLPGYDGSTSVSPPFSWGVAGSSMAGVFAWSQSENVQIDFAQPYEVSFFFQVANFYQARFFEFGHVRLKLDSAGAPLLYDQAGDWTGYAPIGPAVGSYLLPLGQWNLFMVAVNPAGEEYTVEVNGVPLGSAPYSPSLVPSPALYFEDGEAPGSVLEAYYDDILISGAVLQRCVSVGGDFECDGDVDLADFSEFAACFNGPNRGPAIGCGRDTDLDQDGDVDLTDFGIFAACFNGPNRSPRCE